MAVVKTGAASVVVCGVLAVLTLLASDAPALVIVSFWTILAVVFAIWIGVPWRRLMAAQVTTLSDALRANQAEVTTIRSERVVEFEEEEDEGACYAFELRPDASLFVVGQEFYEDVDFPNDDFSIVSVLGTSGSAVDELLIKRGRKMIPVRIVDARVKRTLELPEHLAVVEASVDRVEEALSLLAPPARPPARS